MGSLDDKINPDSDQEKGVSEAEAMATRGDARIHYRLAGRTVRAVMTDGKRLLIRCSDGHEVWIRWNETTGAPELDRVDCRIRLPNVIGSAVVGGL